MNNLEIVLEALDNKEALYALNSNHSMLDTQTRALQEKVKESKKFLLDVEKTQQFYDEVEPVPFLSLFNELKLPFDDCLFTFEKDLVIKWADIEARKYIDTNLMGFVIHQDKTVTFETGKSLTGYKVYLLFREKGAHIKIKKGRTYVGNQYIRFSHGITDEGKGRVFHYDHYPCLNKLVCSIGKNGEHDGTPTRNKKFTVCQEVLTRDSLVETLIYIISKVNYVKSIEVPKKKNMFGEKLSKKLGFGWPWTKGNLPKDDYKLYLDGVSYKYDPDEINYGMGVKHKYRYDVRRHPRIVNNRLVWVEPHKRGKGKYIPKIYVNRKTWFVNYMWYRAEKLSKYRFFELLFIKLFSKLKKKK